MLLCTFCHGDRRRVAPAGEASPPRTPSPSAPRWRRGPGESCVAASSPTALHLHRGPPGRQARTAGSAWERAPEQNRQRFRSSQVTPFALGGNRGHLNHLCTCLIRSASSLGSCCMISTGDKYPSQMGVFPFLSICRKEIISLMHQHFCVGLTQSNTALAVLQRELEILPFFRLLLQVFENLPV